jgi:hypothetical protein
MRAWPFLFAAGKVLDYQLIVCPRPLADKQRMGAFRRWVGPLAEHPTSSPTRAEARDPLMQRYAVLYSCQPARVQGAAVTDCSHRPVHVVTGLLFDKFDAASADFDCRAKEMLARQRAFLWPRFESFWDRITPPAELELSEPVMPDIPATTSPALSGFERLARPHAEPLASGLPLYPAMAAVVALVFVAGIVAASIFFLQSAGQAPSSLAGGMQSTQRLASKLLSNEVFDIDSRPVGTIGDLVIDQDGKVALAIINVDGKPGSPAKRVGVDLRDITGSNDHLTLHSTRDQLSRAPEYRVETAMEAAGSTLPVDSSQPGSSQSGK